MPENQQIQQSKKLDSTFQKQVILTSQPPVSSTASIIQRIRIDPKSLTSADILQLQHIIGNRAVGKLLSKIRSPLMVQQVPVQRQEIPEEESLQGKFENKPEEEICPSYVQKQEIPEEEEPLQGKMIESIQRQVIPNEEEKLQMKSVVQRPEIQEKEKLLQGKMMGTIQRQEIPEKEESLQTKRENNTGMPDNLKAGVENLSGIDMSDVRVHYNSDKPAEVGALAYTQGMNIHVAPGQERSLPHEAWHVVQQAEGRVRPTFQMKGMEVNDDVDLEWEADLMGAKSTKIMQGKSVRYASSMIDVYCDLRDPLLIQRTVFNIGDDPELAEKDGEALSKKLKQEHIKIPIPQLAASDGILAKAENPFVVMFHGSTLRKMGAEGFKNMLIEKGYPRSKGLELVLITCSADTILGSNDAQMLSNVLQSKVRAAKGKVIVQRNGIPYVSIETEGTPTVVHKHDIFELMGDYFEDFADGWNLYIPQPEETLKVIKGDALRQKGKVRMMQMRMAALVKEKDMTKNPSEVVNLNKSVNELIQKAEENYAAAESMKGKATNPQMLEYRKIIDSALGYIDMLDTKIKQIEDDFEAKSRIGMGSHLYDLNIQEMEEAYDGWGSDVDFDALIHSDLHRSREQTRLSGEDTLGRDDAVHMEPEKVTSLKAVNGANSIVQRKIIDNEKKTANGKTLSEIVAGLSDIDLVTNSSNLDLRLTFATMSSSVYGQTKLKANGTIREASKYITRETANEDYEIVIELNKEFYHEGQVKGSIGSLIETLIHEWSLHGAQYAININNARNGLDPDLKIDHNRMFSEEMMYMDIGIAVQISKTENKEFIKQIYQAYMTDVDSHVDIIQKGWCGENPTKGRELYIKFHDLQAIYKIINNNKEKYEKYPSLIKMMEDLDWYLEEPLKSKEYKTLEDVAKLEISNTIELLQELFKIDINDSDDIIKLLHDIINHVISLLTELQDILHIRSLDNPTAARKQALAKLGVDTKELDRLTNKSGLDEGVDFEASRKKYD